MTFFKITCAVIILILGYSDLQAQTAEKDALMNDYHYVQGLIRPTGEDLGDISGTPYYEDGFLEGLIYFPGSEPVTAKVRYNILKEEMQVLFGPANFRVLHDGIPVAIKNDLFQKFSYRAEDKGVDLLGYFRIITKDHKNKNLILMEKPMKEVKEGKKTLRMQMPFKSKYVDDAEFYLKFKNSTKAVLVKGKTSKFFDLFPSEDREKLKDYVDDNNYKSKDEGDLEAIVDYYNANF